MLTLFTASDVLVNEGTHEWPLIVMLDQLQGKVTTWVSSHDRVVALLQDFATDLNVIGYIEIPSVVNQSI